MRMLKWLGGIVLGVIALAIGALLLTQWQIAQVETFAPEDGAPGRLLTVNGNSLHIQTIGDPAADPTGAPVILLHGAEPGGMLTWSPWLDRFRGKRSVVLIDQLGFGHSPRVTTPGPGLSMTARAKDVIAVADQLGLGTFDLVGFSFGGHIAAEVALEAPDRLRKLVLIGAAVYVPPLPPIMDIPLVGRAVAFTLWGGSPFGVWANRCAAANMASEACPWLRLARVKGTTDGMVAGLQSEVLDPTLADRVRRITVPALVVWGGNDREIPVKDGDRLAQALNARMIVVAKAGHWVHQDSPERSFNAVLGFLGG